MWVEIKFDIFENDFNIDEIRKLIQDLLYKNKHHIFIDISNVPAEVFENFSHSNNELIAENFTKFINDSPKISYYVTNNTGNKKCFSPKEAINFFNLPFQIILENSDNDAYFLDSLFREFKGRSKRINFFKANLWLRYINCGGSGNIKHTINAELKNVGSDPKLLRCFVLLDSDLEYPTQVSKREDVKLYLESLDIPYHILEKREVENYLPIENFTQIDPLNSFIVQYSELESVQKDYIDIEKGLQKNKDNLQRDNEEIFNFYNTPELGEERREKKFKDLRKGIGHLFANYKNDYVKLFVDARQEGLIERTKDQVDPNELHLILGKITEQL